jgi:hypothetical protein
VFPPERELEEALAQALGALQLELVGPVGEAAGGLGGRDQAECGED